MSRDMSRLDPAFRTTVDAVLNACLPAGVTMTPYCAERTPPEQAKLWRQSRTIEQIDEAIGLMRNAGATYLAEALDSVGPQHGPHVTNALPGLSWRQWGLAVDCFWRLDDCAEWSSTRRVNGVNGYQLYAQIAQEHGLAAGGLWTSFPDWPHVQKPETASPLSNGTSWVDIDTAMRKRFG